MICPCGSSLEFASCCEPYLKNARKPETAEQLMRARYSAYVTGDMEFIRDTLAPQERSTFDLASTQEWSKKSKWLGLQILSTDKGGADDTEGTVEFMATYQSGKKTLEHHEVSTFRKEQGRWFFVDGDSHTHEEGQGHHHHHTKPQTVVRESPKVGRNDPCPCGSGKKHKKCCAA